MAGGSGWYGEARGGRNNKLSVRTQGFGRASIDVRGSGETYVKCPELEDDDGGVRSDGSLE
jgi:hypothetical protein